MIPALTMVLQPALIEHSTLFREQDTLSPVDRKINPGLPPLSTPDPFAASLREIINLRTDNLESSNIAALRLFLRAFTHLPILLWKTLLFKEMPWLWEARYNSDLSQ